MNDRDRSNLNFLLSVDSTTLGDWFNKSSADDIAYASELLDAYKRELDQKEAQLRNDIVELELNALNHFPEANAVLSQFRL